MSKIVAVGRNYTEHIAELKNEKPEEPVIFLKPSTALLHNNASFHIPAFSQDIHHEVEIVLFVGKSGKNIDRKLALDHIEGIGLGIDFTARDLQTKLKSKSLPWSLAKGFDGSAPLSASVPLSQFPDLSNLNFSLLVNGELRQKGNTSLMLFPLDELIAFISGYMTLEKGDMIFTGTPKGVAAVKPGDRLEGFIEDQKFLDFNVV